MMSGWYSGDEWRWRLRSSGSMPTILVIDSAEKPEPPPHARRVPFGFGPRDQPEPVSEPLRWEGDEA